MGLKLDLGLGVNSGNGIPADYALEFNGTDEYLQIALPNNELLASAGTADFYSSGSAIAGWRSAGTVAWDGAETGKTYTNTITMTGGEGTYSGISKTISGLIIGQKYKLKLRYKPMIAGIQELLIGSQAESGDYFVLSFDAYTAEEWNTVSKIFTAVSTTIAIGTVGGIAHLDYASVKHDQGFDLNKDQEMILHSRNAFFNNAGFDWIPKDGSSNQTCALSKTDKSEGTGSLLITATGAGDATDHHIKLPSANLESCVATKKYTLQGEGRLDPASLTYSATNKVKDGDFSATTYWTIPNPTNFNITGGVAVKSGNPSGVIYQGTSQGVTYTASQVYKVVLTVSGLTGSVSIDLCGGSITALTTEATHTIYLQAGSILALGLRISGGTNTLFTVDNVSVYEATLAPTITAQLGTKSVTSSALSIVSGTFTKFVLNFEATASEENADLKLWLSGAGDVFVDKLSLTQAYDSQTYLKIKPTETAKRTVYNIDSTNFLEFRADGKIGVSVSDGTNTVTNIAEVAYTPNEWIELLIELNRTGNVKIIKGTGTPTGTAITTVGKIIKTSTTSGFRIGANASAGETVKGQIAKMIRTRYDNLTGYSGSEETLRVTFQDGSSIVNCLKDYSPKAHTVSGVLVDITNRKRVIR